MFLHAIQDATIWFAQVDVWTDTLQALQWDGSLDHLVLAQNVRPTDLTGDIQRAFNNFVKTGQAWAFILGLLLGYFIKAFTTFG